LILSDETEPGREASAREGGTTVCKSPLDTAVQIRVSPGNAVEECEDEAGDSNGEKYGTRMLADAEIGDATLVNAHSMYWVGEGEE
jgi:hypothetical protein